MAVEVTLARRSFITGLISLVAAPAIIRAGSLMPVKVMLAEPEYQLDVAYGTMRRLNMLDIDNYGTRQWIDWARKAVAKNTGCPRAQ